MSPHYTTIANTGVEVSDNTSVSVVNAVTTVYVTDNNSYYIAKVTDDINFTTEDLTTPSNFTLIGVGDTVSELRYHRYNPIETPLKWEDLGYVNKYKCLDQSLSSQTVSDSAIDGGDITMSFITARVDEVYFINLVASEITITVNTTGSTPIELHNQTIPLISKNGGTFYNYFFNDFIYKSKLNTPIPISLGVTIDITIKPISGIAKVGLVGIGKTNYTGATLYGAGLGMIDFSKKQIGSTGETYLQQGNYKATNSLTVDIPAGLTDLVYDLLVKYRGIPVMFETDGYDSLILFGIYNKFNILIATPTISKMTIDLESLI